MTIEPVGNGAVIRCLGHAALHRPDDENGGDVIAELVLAARADHDAIVAEVRRLRGAVREYTEQWDAADDYPEWLRTNAAVLALGREYVKAGRGDV